MMVNLVESSSTSTTETGRCDDSTIINLKHKPFEDDLNVENPKKRKVECEKSTNENNDKQAEAEGNCDEDIVILEETEDPNANIDVSTGKKKSESEIIVAKLITHIVNHAYRVSINRKRKRLERLAESSPASYRMALTELSTILTDNRSMFDSNQVIRRRVVAKQCLEKAKASNAASERAKVISAAVANGDQDSQKVCQLTNKELKSRIAYQSLSLLSGMSEIGRLRALCAKLMAQEAKWRQCAQSLQKQTFDLTQVLRKYVVDMESNRRQCLFEEKLGIGDEKEAESESDACSSSPKKATKEATNKKGLPKPLMVTRSVSLQVNMDESVKTSSSKRVTSNASSPSTNLKQTATPGHTTTGAERSQQPVTTSASNPTNNRIISGDDLQTMVQNVLKQQNPSSDNTSTSTSVSNQFPTLRFINGSANNQVVTPKTKPATILYQSGENKKCTQTPTPNKVTVTPPIIPASAGGQNFIPPATRSLYVEKPTNPAHLPLSTATTTTSTLAASKSSTGGTTNNGSGVNVSNIASMPQLVCLSDDDDDICAPNASPCPPKSTPTATSQNSSTGRTFLSVVPQERLMGGTSLAHQQQSIMNKNSTSSIIVDSSNVATHASGIGTTGLNTMPSGGFASDPQQQPKKLILINPLDGSQTSANIRAIFNPAAANVSLNNGLTLPGTALTTSNGMTSNPNAAIFAQLNLQRPQVLQNQQKSTVVTPLPKNMPVLGGGAGTLNSNALLSTNSATTIKNLINAAQRNSSGAGGVTLPPSNIAAPSGDINRPTPNGKIVSTSSSSNVQQQNKPIRFIPPLPEASYLAASLRSPLLGSGEKLPPPKPTLKVNTLKTGIVLSWNLDWKVGVHEEVTKYQLFAFREDNSQQQASSSSNKSSGVWKKVGEVKSLPLPMACTLTQFQSGHTYHFAVRGRDLKMRLGPFSDPKFVPLVNFTKDDK